MAKGEKSQPPGETRGGSPTHFKGGPANLTSVCFPFDKKGPHVRVINLYLINFRISARLKWVSEGISARELEFSGKRTKGKGQRTRTRR